MTTAAAIIIGDEILSGKVRDVNAPLLIDLLAARGVALVRVVFVGDDPAAIADEVRRCSELCDLVVTSGGLGPTHDDRTVEGVARAFAVPVVRHPEVEAMIRRYWGERLNDAALRMANMPAGGRVLPGTDGLLPVIAFRNIYLLPGVPELFAAKLPSLCHELSGHIPVLRSVYLNSDESSVAPVLTHVDDEFPAIKVGSYPRFGEADHRLWVTLEGATEDDVEAALRRLLELLPTDQVVRTE